MWKYTVIVMNSYTLEAKENINLCNGPELTAYLEELGDSQYYSATVSAGSSEVNPPKHELHFILPLNERDILFLEDSFDSKYSFLAAYEDIKSKEKTHLEYNPEELKASRVSEIYEMGLDNIESELRKHRVQAKLMGGLCKMGAIIRPSKAEEFTVRKAMNSKYLPIFIEEILRQDQKEHPVSKVRDFIWNNDPPYKISAYDLGLKPEVFIPLKI